MSNTEQQRREIAKVAVKLMSNMLSQLPEDIRLEAALLLVKALFMAGVKPEHRIGLFNSVVQKMRKELQANIKTGGCGVKELELALTFFVVCLSLAIFIAGFKADVRQLPESVRVNLHAARARSSRGTGDETNHAYPVAAHKR